jgi:hypothetical protein
MQRKRIDPWVVVDDTHPNITVSDGVLGENARRSACGRPTWTADLKACLRPDRVIWVVRSLYPPGVRAVLESGML